MGHFKAPVLHVDTAVVGVRVPASAKEKRTLGRPLHRRCPNQSGRISVEDRRCKAELDLWKKQKTKNKKQKPFSNFSDMTFFFW